MPQLAFGAGRTLEFAPGAVYRDGRRVTLLHRESRPLGGGAVHRFEAEGIAAEVSAAPLEQGAWRIDAVFDAGPGLPEIDRLILFEADVSTAGLERLFSNRREVWLPTGLRRADGTPLEDLHVRDFRAENVMALFTPGGDALLAGILMPGRWGLELTVESGRLAAAVSIESGLPADGRLRVDPFVVAWNAPLLESLIRYGRMNRLGRAGARRPRPVVWNTWDWFGAHLGQDTVVEMARVLARTPPFRDHVNVVCLDDGWAVQGDQATPYPHFSDLAAMAAAVREAGFVPGIWYAPFIADPKSNWVKKHPDTVLWGEDRGFYGTLIGPDAKRFVLDPTHPEVQEKIHRELRALRDAGFRYFKTDFLQQVNSHFKRHRFHDRSATPVEAVRRCLHIVREAIGEDSYWLACGTETLPCAGLADAARTGDDINLHFSTLTVAVRHAAAHFWANGNLWACDPDFLVVRGPATQKSGEPHLHEKEARGGPPVFGRKPYGRAVLGTGPVWNLEEARSWAHFHIVYGGALTLGDHPAKLNETGLGMTAKVLQYAAAGRAGGAGLPLDLEERNVPERWLRPYEGGWLLALFNFRDEDARIALSEADMERIGPVAAAMDIWTGKRTAWPAAAPFAADLAAHASRVWHLERK